VQEHLYVVPIVLVTMKGHEQVHTNVKTD
jgi:hypothetical protein